MRPHPNLAPRHFQVRMMSALGIVFGFLILGLAGLQVLTSALLRTGWPAGLWVGSVVLWLCALSTCAAVVAIGSAVRDTHVHRGLLVERRRIVVVSWLAMTVATALSTATSALALEDTPGVAGVLPLLLAPAIWLLVSVLVGGAVHALERAGVAEPADRKPGW